MDREEISSHYRGPFIDASNQVPVHLAYIKMLVFVSNLHTEWHTISI
jgi:hypothetical protein